MASYRFSAQVISRSSGRTVTSAAAYRAAEKIHDERTGQDHDYTRKGGVLHAEIIAPDNTPDWMHDRNQLWNAVEKIERRKDAQLARELQLNLAHELDFETNRAMVRSYVQEQFVARGMIADLAIHKPNPRGDERNMHAHVMLTMRELTGDGFGKKERAWNSSAQIEEWRALWADYQNREFERLGLDVRVDHRSYERQGIDREPEQHLGASASELERNGEPTDRGDQNRATRARNAEYERMQAEYLEMEDARARQLFDAMDAEGARVGQQQERAEEADRRRGRFEEWTNKRAAELELKQLDARRAIEARQQAELAQHRARMSELYGRDRLELTRQMSELEERAQRGGLRGFLHKLTGRAAQDADSRARIGKTIANLEQREGEANSQIERRHRDALAAIDRQQQQEREAQTERIRAYGIDKGILPREPDTPEPAQSKPELAPVPDNAADGAAERLRALLDSDWSITPEQVRERDRSRERER